jgi:uncharacterized protein
MRDDELRRVLTEANPWWRAAGGDGDPTGWTTSHRLLRDRLTHDLGHRSTVLADIATSAVSDQLVVLTGPRRIGKSVALLDTAASLCRRNDVDPRQIIHLPCDGMRDRDLRRGLTLGREVTRSVDIDGARPRIWLLDEVSSVTGWTAAVKAARDGSALGDDTVVATGSRWSAREDIEGNLMAGRAGSGRGRRRRLLMPMTFREFLTATRPELAHVVRVHPAELQNRDVGVALDALAFDVDAYDLAWQDYLTSGGFPRAVAEHAREGQVSLNYLHDLAAWLRADTDPDAPADSLPMLVHALTERATSPLNITATAQSLSYRNREMFDLRLRRLITAHAALWCPRRDDGVVQPGSQAKLYLADPLLAWLPPRLRAGLPSPAMTTLTEMAIAAALARAIDDLEEGRWINGDTIGYARTASGNEVDLSPVSLPTTSGSALSVPIESKWVDRGWRAEAKTIAGKYRHGILATKSILDTGGDVWAVPAPLLALMLL